MLVVPENTPAVDPVVVRDNDRVKLVELVSSSVSSLFLILATTAKTLFSKVG